MYTQKKHYILQLKVSRFHNHQAILQSEGRNLEFSPEGRW